MDESPEVTRDKLLVLIDRAARQARGFVTTTAYRTPAERDDALLNRSGLSRMEDFNVTIDELRRSVMSLFPG